MKRSTTILALLALGAFMPIKAEADNSAVQSVFENRPELSLFAAALDKTGVGDELKDDQAYTVFAPQNDAFAKIVPEDSKCYRNDKCKASVAAVLRNHIVPGKQSIADLAKKGGTVNSIGSRPVHVDKVADKTSGYRIYGRPVIQENDAGTSMVYSLSGVIATSEEIASLEQNVKDSDAHVEAARAPFIPSRPSLVAPPATR